jgi:hypothetical protein
LGNAPDEVQTHPLDSIGAGHDGSTIRADACGYPGEWGRRGEGDPTHPAEAAISVEAEDAIQAEKAGSGGVEAEIAFSAEVGQNAEHAPAENSNMHNQTPMNQCLDLALETAWWLWI